MKPASPFLVASLFLLSATAIASAQGSCSWSSLGSGVGLYPSSSPGVYALASFDDGSGPALYAGGKFTVAGGVPASVIAKWSGTSWSPLGSGLTFPSVPGCDPNGITGPPCPPDPYCISLTAFDDGTGPALYAGGRFQMAGGVIAPGVARWDGTSWSPLGSGSTNVVHALAVYDDGAGPSLYGAGLFPPPIFAPASRIARWDGTTWSSLGSDVNDTIYDMAVFDDGTGPALYVAGQFISAGGVPVNRIAKWDGFSWSPLGSGLSGGFIPEPLALEVFDDGTGPALYAGGGFTMAGGVPASCIAKWDGSSWAPLGSGMSATPFSPRVYAMTVFDDGAGPALYVGGQFTAAGGGPAQHFARWDGTSWSPLGSGASGTVAPVVYSLAAFEDGIGHALCAGGRFTAAGGQPANYIARWSCGSTISVSATQAAPGGPATINNTNLTPYREYYNIFSLDVALGAPGTGPLAGLWVVSPSNIQFLWHQLMVSVGTPPFHFTAPSSYVNWGPFPVGSVTLDAICFDFTGGILGPVSPVTRITIQ